jgi:hypothetical protein
MLHLPYDLPNRIISENSFGKPSITDMTPAPPARTIVKQSYHP